MLDGDANGMCRKTSLKVLSIGAGEPLKRLFGYGIVGRWAMEFYARTVTR